MEKEMELYDQVYCMDCMELMEVIPDGTASMILTDPPYGISYQNNFTRNRHQLLRGDDGIDYEKFARESYRILKDDTHAYFFTRFDCYPYHYRCLEDAGFQIKNCLAIEKASIGGIGDLHGSYASNCEWIIFCQKGRRVFNHTELLRNKYREGTRFHAGRELSKEFKTRFPACWFGEDYPKATCHPAWQKKSGICHPTVKNVVLLEWLIQISSRPGELVFDGFIGTGSTALAAIRTKRSFLGAEIDRGYYQTAVRRIVEEKRESREKGNR